MIHLDDNTSNRLISLTARIVQRQRRKVGLIMDGSWIQIKILDTILQHTLPVAG